MKPRRCWGEGRAVIDLPASHRVAKESTPLHVVSVLLVYPAVELYAGTSYGDCILWWRYDHYILAAGGLKQAR